MKTTFNVTEREVRTRKLRPKVPPPHNDVVTCEPVEHDQYKILSKKYFSGHHDNAPPPCEHSHTHAHAHTHTPMVIAQTLRYQTVDAAFKNKLRSPHKSPMFVSRMSCKTTVLLSLTVAGKTCKSQLTKSNSVSKLSPGCATQGNLARESNRVVSATQPLLSTRPLAELRALEARIPRECVTFDRTASPDQTDRGVAGLGLDRHCQQIEQAKLHNDFSMGRCIFLRSRLSVFSCAWANPTGKGVGIGQNNNTARKSSLFSAMLKASPKGLCFAVCNVFHWHITRCRNARHRSKMVKLLHSKHCKRYRICVSKSPTFSHCTCCVLAAKLDYKPTSEWTRL